jgi:hypothetical protein
MKMVANAVNLDESGPTVISFADDPEQPKNYVILSYDETEKEAGLHIEVNDQSQSGYNLIERVNILDSSVIIELTSEGSQILQLGPGVAISIPASVQSWDSIRAKIKTLINQFVPVGW